MLNKILFFSTTDIDPYANIALEYSLFKSCPNDALTVFLWQNDNTVVIGKNQNVFNEVDVNALYADGGVVARRLTGGGAVFHDINNLNFTFVANDNYYSLKNQFAVICKALEPFGIVATVSGRNDMTVDGKKFSGNAFLHEGGKSMHHGTLLLNSDVAKMTKYLKVSPAKLNSKGVKSVSSRVINLQSLCDNISPLTLSISIKNAIQQVYNLPLTDGNLSTINKKSFDEFLQKLKSPQWLFNRVTDGDSLIASDRFDWGCVEVNFKLLENKISDLFVFTDSLDAELALIAKKEIEDKKPEQLTSQNTAVCDIIRLIKNTLKI